MNQLEFKEEILKVFPNTSDEFFTKIEIYKNFLNKENQKFNLTRLDNEKVYSDYFYESLIPYQAVDFSNINRVLDIGSGSGIPGVVLKLMYPHLHVDLLESSGKKCEFLNKLIKKLELKDIFVVNRRAEEINDADRETYDMATSRAVSELKVLLEISAPYVKVGGYIIEPKSQKYADELKASQSIIKQLCLKETNSNSFVSVNGIFHYVFFFVKEKPTNHKYPRKWSQIIK